MKHIVFNTYSNEVEVAKFVDVFDVELFNKRHLYMVRGICDHQPQAVDILGVVIRVVGGSNCPSVVMVYDVSTACKQKKRVQKYFSNSLLRQIQFNQFNFIFSSLQ